MFTGIVNNSNPSRIIPVETQYMDVLDEKVLPREVFNLILIGNGTIVAQIEEHECHFSGQTLICLDERKSFHLLAGFATDVKIISFLPEFLNVNMKLNLIRKAKYTELCEQHAFFQLSPFLTENIDKMSFHICMDTYKKVNLCIDRIKQNLTEQRDWYWSCRVRSYFIDIINILERLFHNYHLLETAEDTSYPSKLHTDFKKIIIYINNHLDEKITLNSLYQQFRINKNNIERMFQVYLRTTLSDYLKQRKFEDAVYYLRFTELSGEEIAERLGFSCSQNFCRFFIGISGESPEVFRKSKFEKRIADMRELQLIEENGRMSRKEIVQRVI